jgi:hypothetical protein
VFPRRVIKQQPFASGLPSITTRMHETPASLNYSTMRHSNTTTATKSLCWYERSSNCLFLNFSQSTLD